MKTLYPGNIRLEDLEQKNLVQVSTRGFKNSMYLLYDPRIIKNYDAANEGEIEAFENIANNPKFCNARNDTGIKAFSGNSPKCHIYLNGEIHKTTLDYELKIEGTSKIGRIGLYELHPIQGEGPVILVASNYVEKGFHSSKSINKTYTSSLNIESNEDKIKSSEDLNEEASYSTNNYHNYSKNRYGMFNKVSHVRVSAEETNDNNSVNLRIGLKR